MKKTRLTQQAKVLKFLQTHKDGLTSAQAFWRLGMITRLSGHIFELRKKGYNICTIKEPNRFIEGYHGRYVYLGEESKWWEQTPTFV